MAVRVGGPLGVVGAPLGAVGAVGVPVGPLDGGVNGRVGVAIPLASHRQIINIGEESG